MSRNAEAYFSSNPTNLDIPRSRFKRPFDHKTSLNTGELVPIFIDEVLPGDTVKIDMASLVRMSTPIFPVMDNAFMDIYFFSVPNRLVWEHWKNFMGENTTSYWTPEVEYTMPQTTAPEGGWEKGSIADYMGLPIGVEGISVSSLPFRAMALCYNEWFRSENLIEPLDINKGDSTTAGSNGTDPVVDVEKGGMPPKVGRIADYFSSALPEPQKGPDVFLPLGQSAPVTMGVATNVPGGYTPETRDTVIGQEAIFNQYLIGNSVSSWITADTEASTGIGGNQSVKLLTDLSQATASTINQLRQAFAIQRMYEKDARGGSRYTETIRAHFGVLSPDARQQRPEYLGGKRVPINITQVLQTSSTDGISPQGNASAYSLTIDNDGMFTKSFTEHGLILGFACIRTDRTYQQGIEKLWSRKGRFDYYWPSLANLGEMAILNKEIYAQGTAEDDEVFGYNEAWAEYRYKPNRISGELRSTYALPLDAWHYGDKYNSLPVLGKDWFEETKNNVARTLALDEQDQFIADFYFNTIWTRPMPIYSIPGLIDHH